MQHARRRLVVPIVAIALVAASVFGAGWWAGRHGAIHPLRQKIASIRHGERLVNVDRVTAEERVKAYLDPAAALRDIEDYSWVVPNVPTPFLGHGPRPGVSANAHINYFQCRSARQIAYPKPPSTYRVFLLGGSTAYGSGAPSDERTIGGYLEAELNAELGAHGGVRFEVYTLANPGWATTHERILVENRVVDLEPDLVVSLSGINDVRWGELRRNVLWFRSYADELYYSVLNDVLVLAGETPFLDMAFAEPARVPAEVVATRLARNARLAVCALEERSVPYVFCLQPALQVSQKPRTAREVDASDGEALAYYGACYRAIGDRLREMAAARRLTFADLSAVFDHLTARDDVFLDSCHFGDRGNQIVARAMLATLRPIVRPR